MRVPYSKLSHHYYCSFYMVVVTTVVLVLFFFTQVDISPESEPILRMLAAILAAFAVVKALLFCIKVSSAFCLVFISYSQDAPNDESYPMV